VPTLCNRGSQLFDLGPPPASWANESDLHQVEILPLTAHMGGHAGMQNTAQEHRFTRSLAKSPEVPGQCVFSLLYIISGSPHGVLASMGSLPGQGPSLYGRYFFIPIPTRARYIALCAWISPLYAPLVRHFSFAVTFRLCAS